MYINRSGPCCNLTIHYKKPLEVTRSYDESEDMFKLQLVDFPNVIAYGYTVKEALKHLGSRLCITAQDSLIDDHKELTDRIGLWVWNIPDNTKIKHVTDSYVVLENRKDGC